MSTYMLPAFQKTLQKTERWLDEIMELLDWSDRQQAYKALRVVLHTLRDRLTMEEATDLAAQLPMLIRGLYFEGWNPHHRESEITSIEEFVGTVNEHFNESEFIEQMDITRAVLKVLANHISRGEVEDVIYSLPMKLQALWD